MAKSTRKKAASSAATKPASKSGGGSDRLVGAVWHNGKMYNPGSKADHEAFKKLVEHEDKLGDKNKDGSPRAQLDLQRLADEGVLVGFGTKSSKKGQRAAEQQDEEGFSDDGDAPVGGGVDATEEQDLMEEELEMQDEER